MALTPGLYVPQGEVGTGAAYVHQIKDRSGQMEAIAKASEKQRVNQEKQMAKLKGFDYGKVTDPVMKKHISQKYKEGLTSFAAITAAGGDIASISTPEGVAYATWQEQIEDEAYTASLAESKKQEFRNKVDNPQYGVDPEMVFAVMDEYNNAQTPDEKMAATQNFDPTLLRDFPYNDWINEEIDDAETDKEIIDMDKDSVDYQNIFKDKLKQIPFLLMSKDGGKLAKKQWEVRHRKGEEGFGQNSFAEFLDERIENERVIRESKEQASRTSISMSQNVAGGSTPTNATAQTLTTGTQGQAINFPDLNAAFSGTDASGKKAFWVAPSSGTVPLLVLKGGTDNPADYGLGNDIATANPNDNQSILVKGSNLWKTRTADAPTTLQPADVSKLSVTFKDKNFTDENGNATGGEGSLIYKDQLGNRWLDLVDEASNPRHVILEAGGLTQTYVDAYGKVVPNPLVAIAEANRNGLAKALGVSWQDFSDKYFKNNLKKP
jgi:hypothetical protein